MPVYRVKGVDRNTGENRLAIVSADSEADALKTIDFAVTSITSTRRYRQRLVLVACSVLAFPLIAWAGFVVVPKAASSIAEAMAPPVVYEPEPMVSEIIPRPIPAPEPTYREPTWRDENASVLAYLMMNDFVRMRLKSPSTASFPLDESTTRVRRMGGQRYFVSGSVDATNSFGAVLRSDYAGVVDRVSEDEWHLIDLKIDGR